MKTDRYHMILPSIRIAPHDKLSLITTRPWAVDGLRTLLILDARGTGDATHARPKRRAMRARAREASACERPPAGTGEVRVAAAGPSGPRQAFP
jgi:hypothetical protein